MSRQNRFSNIKLILVLFIALTLTAAAQAMVCTTTGPYEVCTDKADYRPEETVTITGSGFEADSTLLIKVTRPDGTIVSGDGLFDEIYPKEYDYATTNYQGNLYFEYMLNGVLGNYTIEVLDSQNNVLATHIFSDAPAQIDLDQARNGAADSPNSPIDWVNGNAGEQNSHYLEGYSIPYRSVMSNLPINTSITVVFGYDTKQSDRHAIDYLTYYDRLNDPLHTDAFNHGAETINPLEGVIGVSGLTTTYTIPLPSATDIDVPNQPTDSYNALDPEEKVMTLFGGTISDMYYVDQGNLTGSQSETQIAVVFEADSPTAVLSWGGHIASREDWGYDSQGVPHSAGGISGSPYHMRLVSWTLGNIGNTDRSLSGAAVFIPPATITIIKDTVPDNGQDFTFTSTGLTPTSFSLDDDADGTLSNTQVFTQVEPGTYTITEGANPQGFALTNISCSAGSADLNTRTATIDILGGENITCVFTNELSQGNLIVYKQVINDNGGTATASQFTLHVNESGGSDVGGSPQAGSETGTVYTLNAGNYAVSENMPVLGYTRTGFSGDCDISGNVEVLAGQNVTCTITNDDNAPSLTLNKIVVNDDGGTATASQWTLTATGPTGFSGSGPTVNNGASFDAGAYTLSESGPAGYTASAWTCVGATQEGNQITVALGESAVCNITNDDIVPMLKLVKVVTNDDGGTAVSGDWNLTASGTNGFTDSGDSATFHAVDAGVQYTLTETSMPGYTAGSWSCDGGVQSTNHITLSVGQNVTCTITNDDQQAYITVVKVVNNNYGGTAQPDDFDLTLGGSPVSSGVAVPVNPGTYASGESLVAGYSFEGFSGDCDENGSLTVALGESKTCTLTNDDIAPMLRVIKHVVNDNGGTLEAGDFTMHVNATSPSQDTFAGNESGTMITLYAGDYDVTEDELYGYAASYSEDCAGSIGIGEEKTCTITNDDIQPVLKLTKIVVNDDGGTLNVSDFALDVNGTPVISGEENGFNAGDYMAGEQEQFGYAAGDWTGDCAADGSVSLSVGDNKTCTITNDDIAPTLRLVKTVVNNNGGTLGVGDFNAYIDNESVTWNGTVILSAGSYMASEDEMYGYAASAWSGDCASDGSVTLSVGENKVCYITNDDIAPKLTVTKVVNNSYGGTLAPGDFPLYVDQTSVLSGVQNDFDAGMYTVSEDEQDGYELVSIVCDGQATDEVTLAVGDVKECTITNKDIQPRLTVTKVVVNDNGGTAIVENFTLYVGDGVVVSGAENGFDVGTYMVSEDQMFGYSSSISGDCDENGTVSLELADNKTCVITNDDIAPKLNVIKHVINDNGGTLVADNFTMHVNATNPSQSMFAGNESGTMITLYPGDYAVTEDEIFGYNASYSEDCEGSIGIGEEKTCTITNDDISPKLIVYKHVINKAGNLTASDFTINVSAINADPSGFAGDENGTLVMLDAGTYAVTEQMNEDYEANYTEDCEGSIGIGEERTCTITNTEIIKVTRTQGFWQTHTEFTLRIFNDYAGGEIVIGVGNGSKMIDGSGKLFGAYYSSIPKNSDDSFRYDIDHARMQLLQQLLTAKLNCAAFGCSQSVNDMVSDADEAYSGSDKNLILQLASDLDAYNNKYDNESIPSELGDWGSATPKDSKAVADIPFWDTEAMPKAGGPKNTAATTVSSKRSGGGIGGGSSLSAPSGNESINSTSQTVPSNGSKPKVTSSSASAPSDNAQGVANGQSKGAAEGTTQEDVNKPGKKINMFQKLFFFLKGLFV